MNEGKRKDTLEGADSSEQFDYNAKSSYLQGACIFCGQARLVNVKDGEDPNERATLECDCAEGSVERTEKRLVESIDDIAEAPEFMELNTSIRREICEVAVEIIQDNLEKATFDDGESVVTLKMKDHKLNIERKKQDVIVKII